MLSRGGGGGGGLIFAAEKRIRLNPCAALGNDNLRRSKRVPNSLRPTFGPGLISKRMNIANFRVADDRATPFGIGGQDLSGKVAAESIGPCTSTYIVHPASELKLAS